MKIKLKKINGLWKAKYKKSVVINKDIKTAFDQLIDVINNKDVQEIKPEVNDSAFFERMNSDVMALHGISIWGKS